MKLMSLKIIIYLPLFFPFLIFSQNNSDSIIISPNSQNTFYFIENQFEQDYPKDTINNSLDNFQIVFSKNHLGNIGLAFNDLLPPSVSTNIGFVFSKNNFRNYFSNAQNIKYYDTKSPHTDLFYLAGSKKEQLFDMKFSYNVKKNWNVTAAFNRIRSDGFYLRQNTNDNFLSVSSNFKSLNNRYYFLFNIIYNKAAIAENGGLASDNTLTNNTNLSPLLSNANKTTLNKSVYFKQYVNFGNNLTDSTKLNYIIPSNRIIITGLYENDIYTYADQNPVSGYYSEIYFDSTKTLDSTNIDKIENELKWQRLDNKLHRGFRDIFGVSISLRHQLVSIHLNEKYKSGNSSAIFNNIITSSELYNTYSKNNFWWNATYSYALNGYNKNNYYAGLTLKKDIIDSLNTITIKSETQSKTPDYIYNHYSSNNFKWENNFKQINQSQISINYSNKKYKFNLNGKYSTYSNFVYFDYLAQPWQYKTTIEVLSIFLNKDFALYNFHLNNTIRYQYTPTETALRIPELILEHSFFYESHLFHKALKIQIGVSLFYISEYYANAYMPATAQFYLQHDNKIGNYPFIDFFINTQIKTVRIFFKIDHLNSGWSGNNYELTPHYPQNTRAFKLGVSWRFFD